MAYKKNKQLDVHDGGVVMTITVAEYDQLHAQIKTLTEQIALLKQQQSQLLLPLNHDL